MIRYGRTFKLIDSIIRSHPVSIQNSHRVLTVLRSYSKKDGKHPPGSTAKVEDCLPPGSKKNIPAASAKKCTGQNVGKVKIPSSPPKRPDTVCPPSRSPPDSSICAKPTGECVPGGTRNPVQQVCKKPNVMDVCKTADAKKKETFYRNLILGLLFLLVAALMMYQLGAFGGKGGAGGGGIFGGGSGSGDKDGSDDSSKCKKKRRRKERLIVKNPTSSKDIPREVQYLLIGGGTAAFSAFRSIKSLDPTAKVLVVTDECYLPYMRPPLSKEMWFNEDTSQTSKLMFRQWNGTPRSVFFEPESFYMQAKQLNGSSKGGVAVAAGWTITQLDPYNRRATLDDGSTITYGKCLIATGSSPKSLPAVEKGGCDVEDKISTFRGIYDFQELHEVVTSDDVEQVAVIGGGFLGSELACALARFGKDKLKVTQVFKESGNMGKVLPEYLSMWTTKKVEEEGVTVIPNANVVDSKVVDDHLVLSLSNGKTIQADHAVVAIGAKPNTSLASSAQLELDPGNGGYLVNAELEARSHLYIAGDAACFFDIKFGRRRVEHHDHAVVSGRLAGENMVGAGKPYLHQSMFWSDLGPRVGFEAIGIVDSSLPTVGVFAKATEQDTPEAVAQQTNEPMRSESEANAAPVPPAQGSQKPPQPGEDFGKGVIFYLRDDIVVGIVLWNVFNRMQIARQVLKEDKKYEDLNEVAKLFNIHED